MAVIDQHPLWLVADHVGRAFTTHDRPIRNRQFRVMTLNGQRESEMNRKVKWPIITVIIIDK